MSGETRSDGEGGTHNEGVIRQLRTQLSDVERRLGDVTDAVGGIRAASDEVSEEEAIDAQIRGRLTAARATGWSVQFGVDGTATLLSRRQKQVLLGGGDWRSAHVTPEEEQADHERAVRNKERGERQEVTRRAVYAETLERARLGVGWKIDRDGKAYWWDPREVDDAATSD